MDAVGIVIVDSSSFGKKILQSWTVLKDWSSGLQAIFSRHQILLLAELWPSLKIPQVLPYPLVVFSKA